MIDLNKKYTTLSHNNNIRLYDIIDGIVFGSICLAGSWMSATWDIDGNYFYKKQASGLDLVEVENE